MFSPAVEAGVRRTQERVTKLAERAERQAAKRDEETRSSLSPNDILAQEKWTAARKYWLDLYEAGEERKRQEKIREANPTLIKLKADFMTEANSAKRVRLATNFAELYRKSYGKQVPVEAIVKEWDDERRKTFLARIYGAKQ